MRLISSGLGILAMAIVVSACSSGVAGFGSSKDDIKLPERDPDPVDGGKPTTPPEEMPEAGPLPPEPMDAGTEAGPTRSAYCSEADLVLCYEFENVAKDSSVNAIDPQMVQGLTFVPGKTGMAALVDTTSAIRFGYSAMLNSTAATIEAWVILGQNNNRGVVFDADARFAMEIEPNGDLHCNTPNGAVTGGNVARGVFTHVACTFDTAGKIHNFVAGMERDNGNGRIGTSTTAVAAIGGDAPTGSPFVGTIDSLRIFRVARGATQIAQDVAQ